MAPEKPEPVPGQEIVHSITNNSRDETENLPESPPSAEIRRDRECGIGAYPRHLQGPFPLDPHQRVNLGHVRVSRHHAGRKTALKSGETEEVSAFVPQDELYRRIAETTETIVEQDRGAHPGGQLNFRPPSRCR